MRFDPTKEKFDVFALPTPAANVRQILGRPGEIWGAESGADKLVVVKTSNWEDVVTDTNIIHYHSGQNVRLCGNKSPEVDTRLKKYLIFS